MSTPTDIERRAKQVTRRQERETKRRYELLAGLVRSQLRKQLDEILKLNTKAFVMLLLEGGALKVNVEVAEKPPAIDAPTEPTTAELEAAARALGLDLNSDPNATPIAIEAFQKRQRDEGGQYDESVPMFDQTVYDEIKSGKLPPGLTEPSFPPPVAYIPGEDRFEDEPVKEPPPLLVPA